MNRQDIVAYYSRDDVVSALLRDSKDREVAGAFWDGTYDKRPNMIQFKNDVVQMAKNGVTSLHFSVEHWSNPMVINSENYNRLRTGWDMIIDIDSKLGIDEAKTAVELIVGLLKKYGINNYGLKFSGRRGFHISLPWIMFPKNIDYKNVARMYPKVPRIIARFIRKKIADDLMKELIHTNTAKKLIELLGETPAKMNPYYFVEVEKDWGNRHMFRAPYSLNEKTWLASIPIKFSDLRSFTPEMAKPDKIKTDVEFFKGEENEAADLLTEAIDWFATVKKKETKKKTVKINWERKITEDMFPPCITTILAGLEDGRKRSIFTLINFLRMCNWSNEEIEQKIFEWNSKNARPLPRNLLVTQLRYSQQNPMNPANCDVDTFYGDIGICRPDNICKKGTDKIVIKNPLSYPFRKMQNRPKKKFRGFSCGACGKEFKTARSLEWHKNRYH